MPNVTLKRFEVPDEVRRFPRGRLDLVAVGGLMIGRATHEPGYRWSVDTAPSVGTSRCHLEHVGLVLQGRATTAFDDGRAWELTPGTLFTSPPSPMTCGSWEVSPTCLYIFSVKGTMPSNGRGKVLAQAPTLPLVPFRCGTHGRRDVARAFPVRSKACPSAARSPRCPAERTLHRRHPRPRPTNSSSTLCPASRPRNSRTCSCSSLSRVPLGRRDTERSRTDRSQRRRIPSGRPSATTPSSPAWRTTQNWRP